LYFNETVEERRKKALAMAPDAPPFDLDTPPDECEFSEEATEKDASMKVKGLISAAGQEGCSKTQQYASSNINTHVPHEYQKRVVKAGRFETSPDVTFGSQKLVSASKSVKCLYKMVCEHGSKKIQYITKKWLLILVTTTYPYNN
jgi:hypothetical protein